MESRSGLCRQPQTEPASVLGDEFDTGGLEGGTKGGKIVFDGNMGAGFKIRDCGRRSPGELGKVLLRQTNECTSRTSANDPKRTSQPVSG